MTTTYANGKISHWMSAGGKPDIQRRDPRSEPYDLVIVGGGMTGLWAAYYAIRDNPGMSVAVLEAREIGYGASGRNGGWLSTLVAGNRGVYARSFGLEATKDLQRATIESIDEVLNVLDREGIEADQVRGGNLEVATTPAGTNRLRARRAADLRYGYAPEEVVELSAEETRERVNVDGAVGGLFLPNTARIDPAKMVRGLGEVLERSGVEIFENTRVLRLGKGVVSTARGPVRGERILCCTEGYSGPLLGKREIIPINSSMIVTEPLPQRHWEQIGWASREVLGDAAHTFVYAQRTADDRIAIGGRGAPYGYNSATGGDGPIDARTVALLHKRLSQFFPGLEFPIAHAWKGVLGVTRDWCASVMYDHERGWGYARGYAGHGVTATNLAARTLLDRANRQQTRLTRLPWNDHDSGKWEPEPIRWLGIHAMYRLFGVADAWEENRHTQKTSLLARLGSRLAGLHE